MFAALIFTLFILFNPGEANTLKHKVNNNENTDISGHGWWWVIYIFAALMGSALLRVCLRICYKRCKKSFGGTTLNYVPTMPCYLCLGDVKLAFWTDGSHRKACARGNMSVLAALRTPFTFARCPKCENRLRQWPDRGTYFTCDGANCPLGEAAKIVNNGENRFNCFVCDYDLCLTCVRRTDEEERSRTEPSAPVQIVVGHHHHHHSSPAVSSVDGGRRRGSSTGGGWITPRTCVSQEQIAYPDEPPPNYAELQL